MSADNIAKRVADLDPLCWSTEGIDDCCHFCGSDHLHSTFRPSYQRWATHHPDCVWVAARILAGQPIDPHTVRSTEPTPSG